MSVENTRRGPLADVRVVEIATTIAAEQTGRVLREQGAEVLKVEPSGGAFSRRVGPWADGVESPDTSLNFWFYNAGKTSHVLDLPAQRDGLDDLLADADVLVVSLRPSELSAAGLDLEAIRAERPRLIVLSVTDFGLTGPWVERRSSDLVGLALGGPLMSCGYDDHSIPPIRPGGNQSYHTAASFAINAVMLALISREATGEGQLIDVAMHDAMSVSGELANPYWFYPQAIVQRQTARHAQPEPTSSTLFECGDGKHVYIALVLSDQRAWKILVSWMEAHDLAADLVEPEYDDFAHRQANFAHVQEVMEVFLVLMTADQAFREGAEWGIPVGLVQSLDEVAEDEHLLARGFFHDVEVGEGRTVRFPGPAHRFSTYEACPVEPAPALVERGVAS